MTPREQCAEDAPLTLVKLVKREYHRDREVAYKAVSDYLWSHSVGQVHSMSDEFVAAVMSLIYDR